VAVFSVVCAGAGCVLIGWSIFLYESEEHQISDTLEEWWITLDDIAQHSVSRSVRIVNKISHTITMWLDFTFGRRLFSFRAVVVSWCFSLSAFQLMACAFIIRKAPIDWAEAIPAAFGGIGCLFAAISERFPDLRYLVTVGAGIALLLLMLGVTFDRSVTNAVDTGTSVAFGCAAGVLADFSVIVVSRYLARRGANARSVGWPILAAFAGGLLAAAIFVLPMLPIWMLRAWWALALYIFALTNLYSAIVAASFTFMAITLILHRLLWPILNRPLYAIQRFRLFEQRKVLFGAGATLLGLASPALTHLFTDIGRALIP
jgi:hypothetical protein